jgi:uncharacterized cupin superfamily protein
VELFNVFTGELDDDPDRAGYCQRWKRIGPQLGAQRLGMTIYHLEVGERICPYHFEHGDEEWLLVLSGQPTLRTPAGSRTLEEGDVVCFPAGPDGAHDITGPARVAMLSTRIEPAVAEYPDSDKVGIWMNGPQHMLRRQPQLDYWDGEA